jgi:hypothetical protein
VAFEPDHPTLNLQATQFYDPSVCGAGPSPVFSDANGNPCANWPGAYDGNLGRNTFRGPSFADVDLSLFKNFKVSEAVNFQFRAEAFNLFNRTNLKMPSANFNGSGSSLFGLSTGTSWPRQIQFALRMTF